MTSDPIPEIVRLLNFVKSGKNISSSNIFNFGDNDLEFQINAWHERHEKIWLTFKIFYKPIYGKGIDFSCVYKRDKLAAMLKKFPADVLNDEKFLYNRAEGVII